MSSPNPPPGSHAASSIHTCKIIQGPIALSAQLVLLAIVVTALAIKRHRERPRRAWNVWLLDISKQGFSAGAGHLCGMAIAVVAHHRSGAQGASECGWYFVVYIMDCTLGITLAILFHKLMGRAAKWAHMRVQASKDLLDDHEHHWTEALVESGNYGEPPNYRKWAIQVGGWVTCVISARLSVGMTLMLSLRIMSHVSLALDRALGHHPSAYLFTVMVGVPMCLNVAQAWIQDQVLKRRMRKHQKRGGGADTLLIGLSSDAPPVLQHSSERDRERGEMQNMGGGGGGAGSRSSEKLPLLGGMV